eukprot:Ihof_evm5s246 gene=Ihof_evmTU5s246
MSDKEEATSFTPLLPEKEFLEGQPESSPTQSFINLVKVSIGTGIITIPYGFSKGGILAGTLLIVFIAIANFVSVYWLIKCYGNVSPKAIIYTKSSYSAVGWEAGGRWGAFSVDLAIVITSVGAAISYLIFIENTMFDVSQALSKAQWVLIGIIPLIYLICLDDLAFLTWVSIGGIMALIVGYGSVFGYGIMTQTFTITPGDMFIPKGVPQMFSLLVFSCCYPCVFFPIYEQMRKKNDAEFFRMLLAALVVTVALFSVVGIVSMGLYKEAGVQEIIINNLPKHSIFANIMRCALSLVILFSYPLAFFIFNQVVGRHSMQLVSGQRAKRIMDLSSRIMGLLLSSVIAIVFPNLADVVSLLGAFSVSYLCFVFPSFAYLR